MFIFQRGSCMLGPYRRFHGDPKARTWGSKGRGRGHRGLIRVSGSNRVNNGGLGHAQRRLPWKSTSGSCFQETNRNFRQVTFGITKPLHDVTFTGNDRLVASSADDGWARSAQSTTSGPGFESGLRDEQTDRWDSNPHLPNGEKDLDAYCRGSHHFLVPGTFAIPIWRPPKSL